MAQFKAFDPRVEVNGQTVLSVMDGMGVFKQRALRILADNGIPDPQPGQWYPQQAWLNAFKTIAESLGPATLFQIGMRIPAHADWPPDIDSVEKAMSSIDVAYHMNHRYGEIGHYTFEKRSERSGVMICNNPYPCDFDRGIIEAVARKFAPGGATVIVKHDDRQPCRKQGADSCTYLVLW